MNVATRLARLEQVVVQEDDRRRPPCSHPFHRTVPNYRQAAAPLNPHGDGTRVRCPDCGQVGGAITIEPIIVDMYLREVIQ